MANSEAPTPVNCFVAMFDVLGFKKLRESKGTGGLYQLYNRFLKPAIQHSAAGAEESEVIEGVQKYVPPPSQVSCAYIAVSNTIVFYTPDNSFESFLNIVNSSYQLLQFGFYRSKTPFRGSIGYGDLIVDPEIFIGSAIEDAYAGEQQQAWAGCMLTEKCSNFVTSERYIKRFNTFHREEADKVDEIQRETILRAGRRLVKYDSVPIYQNPKDRTIKYSERESYVIDWTLEIYEGAGEKAFNPTSDIHAKVINYNTSAFEKWARENNQT